jgi:hypothetical protein
MDKAFSRQALPLICNIYNGKMMMMDPWWQTQLAIDELNELRKDHSVFSIC